MPCQNAILVPLPICMVKYTKSDMKKQLQKLSQHEKKLTQAFEVYWAEQEKSPSACHGLRKIAELYGVNHNMLHQKVNVKGKTHCEYLQGCQKLSLNQEACLVELLIEMDQHGLGFDHEDICLYTLAILS